MKENSASRSLLLERLESRCLLAGGAFLFSDGIADDRHGRDEHRGQAGGSGDRSRADRSGEVRQAERGQADHHRHESSSHRVGRSDRHDAFPGNRRHDPPVAPGGEPLAFRVTPEFSAVSPSEMAPDAPPIRIPNATPGDSSGGTLGDGPPNGLQPDSSGDTGSLIFVNVNVSPSPSRVVTETDATGDSQTKMEAAPNSISGPESPVDSAAETGGAEGSATPNAQFAVGESAAANTILSESAGATTDRLAASNGAPLDGSGSEKMDRLFEDIFSQQTEPGVGGMIEPLMPRISNGSTSPQPLLQEDTSEDASWQIERETIRRLGQMGDSSLQEHSGATDLAMRGWFGGPGGLIEIQSGRGVLPMDDAVGSFVDIPLDVILGSHRSLELVAAANFSGTGTDIRDAVLAAIAGEQSDHATPLQEQRSTRFQPIAYSGAALIATTLAIAGRRKQARLLCKTSGGETSVARRTH